MEEVILRFPHLADQIFAKLGGKSLVKCTKVNGFWKDYINTKKSYYYKIIQQYTNCSDELMKKLVKNVGLAKELVSDLQIIFKKFPKGTRQQCSF